MMEQRKACDRCTAHKAACDGQRPCSRCHRTGHENACSYSVAKRRGPKGKRVYGEGSTVSDELGDGSSITSSSAAAPQPAPAAAAPSASAPSSAGHKRPRPSLHSEPYGPLFWPQNHGTPLGRDAKEIAYCNAFFQKAGGVKSGGLLSEDLFWNAVRSTAGWPQSGTHAADAGAGRGQGHAGPGQGAASSQQSTSDAHAHAVGIAFLYDVICGLGASAMGQTRDCITYLQRALPRASAVMVAPSETAAMALLLLSVAMLRVYGSNSYGHKALLSQADMMVSHLTKCGAVSPENTWLQTVIPIHVVIANSVPGQRIVVPVPAADDSREAFRHRILLCFTEGMYGLAGRPEVEQAQAAAASVAQQHHGAGGGSSSHAATEGQHDAMRTFATQVSNCSFQLAKSLSSRSITDSTIFRLSDVVARVVGGLSIEPELLTTILAGLRKPKPNTISQVAVIAARLITTVCEWTEGGAAGSSVGAGSTHTASSGGAAPGLSRLLSLITAATGDTATDSAASTRLALEVMDACCDAAVRDGGRRAWALGVVEDVPAALVELANAASNGYHTAPNHNTASVEHDAAGGHASQPQREGDGGHQHDTGAAAARSGASDRQATRPAASSSSRGTSSKRSYGWDGTEFGRIWSETMATAERIAPLLKQLVASERTRLGLAAEAGGPQSGEGSTGAGHSSAASTVSASSMTTIPPADAEARPRLTIGAGPSVASGGHGLHLTGPGDIGRYTGPVAGMGGTGLPMAISAEVWGMGDLDGAVTPGGGLDFRGPAASPLTGLQQMAPHPNFGAGVGEPSLGYHPTGFGMGATGTGMGLAQPEPETSVGFGLDLPMFLPDFLGDDLGL